MHNWLDGIKRAPLHLLAFGVPAGIVGLWLPWYSVIGLFCLRLGQEIDDVTEKRDTLVKGIIDTATSVVIPLLVALLC